MRFIDQQTDKKIAPATVTYRSYIENRIKNNKNFLCTITGATGSGKSYSALSLMETLNPNKTPEELIKNTAFDAQEFMSRINSGELTTGDVLLWDESGVGLSSKNWQSLANKSINYLLQTFRNMNLIVIFTLPYFTFLDNSSRKLMHCLMQTESIDRSKQIAILKPLLLTINQSTGKTYSKYLIVSNKKGFNLKVKRLAVAKPSEKLVELYEAKKTTFTQKLNQDIEKKLDTAQKKEAKAIDPLTARQRQIADMFLDGLNMTQIAQQLQIPISSVSGHIQAIEKKGIDIKKMKSDKEKSVSLGIMVRSLPSSLTYPLSPLVDRQ